MPSRQDYMSVLEAKQNEITSKDLDDLYGKMGEFSSEIKIEKAYDYYDLYDQESLIAALEATKVPKYVRLAKFMKETMYVSSNYVARKQAEALLEKEENKYTYGSTAKTLYKEFNQIEKRAKKLNRKASRKLRKYKDAREFIFNIDAIIMEMKRTGILRGYYADYDIDDLTEFFDSRPELDFLDKSKLTKYVR